jgi:hypothetical protein
LKTSDEGNLSEDLYLLVQDLAWVLNHQDPGLDFFQTLSLVHHLREIAIIIRKNEKEQQCEEVNSNREFCGDRTTALDSLQLLIQIGGSLELPEEKGDTHAQNKLQSAES